MRAGRFVGRVGGLAVALGVGVAIASGPPTAWADEGTSSGTDAAAPASTASEDTDGASTGTTSTEQAADASSASGSGASTPSDPVDTSVPDTSASTGASVRTAPPGTAISTGGADFSADEPTATPKAKRSAPKHGSKKSQRQDDSTESTAQPTTQVVSQPKDAEPDNRVAQESATPPSAGPVSTTPTAVVATQDISASTDVPTEPTDTVSEVALTAPVELDPLAPSGPLAPVDSPLELALLAVGARTRTETIDGEQTFAAAMVMSPNSAPTVPTQPVGTPDPLTGVVIGTVIATDPDNNPLVYTVTNGPSNGTVVLNSQTGAYTYTPTQAARVAAGATTTVDTDSFTVTVSDGQQTSSALVSVYISPIRFEAQAPIAVATNPSAAVIGADGRMWVTNTGSNTVSVINTVTGQRIDANSSSYSKDISVGSSPSALALSADGKRLYVANTGSGTVSVIDTATYKRIDVNPSWFSKDIKVGSAPDALAFGADGRLYVANRNSNTVSVINTATNKLIDTNPNISGTQSISVGTAPRALALNGTQLYVANRSSNTVSVVDTSTYSVTNTISVGSQPSSLALDSSGRLWVANTGNGTVSVINAATNTVGVNAIPVGPSPSSVAFSADGRLAYVANANDTVSVIDTAGYTVLSTVAIDTDTTGGHVVAVGSNGTILVTDAADKTVRVLIPRYGNAAPAAGTPTVSAPNVGSGAVSGALNFTDRDGDTLSYSVTQPSTGTVSITSAGLYTFTPTDAARQAAATGGPASTTFTVKATDGQATTPVSVTVPIAVPFAPTSVTALGSVSVTGDPSPTWPVVSPDGKRAVIITPVTNRYTFAKTTRVAVIDTATGKQVGSTLTLTGAGQTPVFSADGTRALITTTTPNTTTGIETTRVTVLNTMTGAQAGTTVTLTGSPAGIQLLGADGSRALITTDAYDVYDWDGTVAHSTAVTVVNTTTGALTGTTLSMTGGLSSLQLLGADQGRALITTSDSIGGLTRLAVFNTTTGTQTGTTLSVAGKTSETILLGTDGNRALVTTADATSNTTRVILVNTATATQTGTTVTLTGGTADTQLLGTTGSRALIATSDAGSGTTRVTVINTTTGTQIGTTVAVTGAESGTMALGNDDSRALIITSGGDGKSTGLTVINTITGTQIGTTVTVTGVAWGSPMLTADGSRALITTQTYDDLYDTSTYTTRVAVVNTDTGAQQGSTISLVGAGESPTFSADGKHALITTTVSPWGESWNVNTSRVTLIDTTTGAQTGTTFTLAGAASPQFSADGTRLLITTRYRHPTTGVESSQVVVVNAATGAQIGSTLNLPPSSLQLLNASGTRALLTTSSYNINTVSTTMHWAVLDTTTGAQTAGSTQTFHGYLSSGSTLLSADGTQAIISTSTYDDFGHFATTYVTVINTATGAQIGSTLTLGGYAIGYPSPALNADGSRALVITNPRDYATGKDTTQVAVINPTTGKQIGTTLTFAGYPAGKVLLGVSGNLAVIAIGNGTSTRVVVLNMTTGAQTATFTVTGAPQGSVVLTADGTRAVLTTATYNSLTSVTTRVTVLRIA